MLKTRSHNVSERLGKVKKPAKPKPSPVKLTPDQEARLIAFRKFVKDKQEAWDALSPSEQQEDTESWERIMNRINEDRKGYRPVFVDP